MKEKYIDINLIKEKDFIDYSIKDFVFSSELELYNFSYKEYFEKIKNYLLSKTLKIIRNNFSLTQKEFSKKIGKSEILIRKYEKGSININNNVVLLIIKTFSLNFSSFNDFLIRASHEFIYSGEYEKLRDDYFYLFCTFESFNKLNDIAETFIKGELDIIKYVLQNIMDTFFYNNSNNEINKNEYNKKIDLKGLEKNINFIEFLKKNNYIVHEISKTETVLKKENDFYKVSNEKLNEISKQVNIYTEFLLSSFKTQK